MAIKVNFYRFTKKENSTARPSGTGTELDCTLKDSSSIFFPIIKLNLGAVSAPSFNYCIIPNFNRWYYITNWEWDRGLWYASLQVDVLATYKPEIGNSSLYALRASNSWDGRIVDNLYPTKVNCTYSKTDVWNHNLAFGMSYIIGVVTKNPSYGSITYYAMTRSQLRTLMAELLDDTLLTGNNFNPADASLALQKSIVDPLQYIKSAIAVPLTIDDMGANVGIDETITIFDWDLTAQGKRCGMTGFPRVNKTHTFTIPKHPQTATRGNFVNQAPYTYLTLYAPPFGVIELDTTAFAADTALTVGLTFDLPTGQGALTITNESGNVIQRVEAQLGVPIQLSQVSRDYLGATVSGISAIGSAIGGAVSGNVTGAITGLASGIGNAVSAMAPKSQTLGSGGSYMNFGIGFYLQAQFFEIVDDDISHNGRPLCQMVTPSAGYYLIQDGDVPIDGTKEEAIELKRYLEGGFYYE